MTRRRLPRDAYVEGVLRGDRTILSRAITLIESLHSEDTELAQDVLEQCLPYAGDSIRVGITGVPGVGKSSLIEVLGAYLTSERSEKVAVLAVDPSSQVSRGSILGDKTRMETLANEGIKRGIVEMTDLIAFNKADGSNRATAEAARRQYENALHLFAASGTGWTPRVITCSARAREGIAEIWDAVLEHNAWLTSTGQLASFRQQQVKSWMYELIEQALRDEFLQHGGVREKLASYEQEVLAGQLSPFRAARRLIRIYTENPS